MLAAEAEVVLALLHHLDGSQLLDEIDLTAELVTLHEHAAAAFRGGALPLDEDTLCDTLTQVTQRHADAGR